MNYLFLMMRGPQNFHKYQCAIASKLESLGHNVFYAFEGHIVEEQWGTVDSKNKFYFDDKFPILDQKRCFDEFNAENIMYGLFACYTKMGFYNYTTQQNKLRRPNEIIIRVVSFFEWIIKKCKIDRVVHEAVSNSWNYIAYVLINKNKGLYIGHIMSRIPDRCEIWQDLYGNIEFRREYFDKIKVITKEEKDKLVKYISQINDILPTYMHNNPFSMHYKQYRYIIERYRLIPIVMKSILYHRSDSSYLHPLPYVTAFRHLERDFVRKIKVKLLRRYYDEVDDSIKYYLFPLHYQPEASTSICSMYFSNQLEVITNIAFSLPLGSYLVVKDHPNGIGYMPMYFYREIKKLPNVIYVDPLSDKNELMKKSIGVITLTGTMGYEALLMNKPVVALGTPFYMYHPYCFKVMSYSELFNILHEIINFQRDDFCEKNIKFLKTYFDTTFIDSYTKNPSFESVQNIVNYIVKI